MCLYPDYLKNPKYKATKKNGGNIPPLIDKRVEYVPIGCGKCIECRSQKAREWKVRLSEEIKVSRNGKFVTLTFSDESLNKLDKRLDKEEGGKELTGYNRDNAICSLAVRLFLERWRKKYKKSVRHWLVTEIGGKRTERIHIHGIIFTEAVDCISERWGYGYVYAGEYVNQKTINYIVKYVYKIDEKHKEYKSKIYASKGIGKNYFERKDSQRNKYKKNETIETYKTSGGYELSLPIYYRNKIYTEEEREKLWIEKLDKQERWVCGVKVDISENEDEYYKLLKEKRLMNKRLGYGDDVINWELKKYEQDRRNLKRLERMAKIEKS